MRKAWVIVCCILGALLIGIVLVRAILFPGYKDPGTSGKYAVLQSSAILIDSTRTDPFEQDGSFREVPVHFYYPETVAGSTERFPLVAFSHGAFGYYQSNTSTYRELAGNGYVVVALDHPHHAFYTKDSDGKTVIVDRQFLRTAMRLNDGMDAPERYGLYTEWMTLRTADMNFVIDELKATANADTLSVLERVDFSKIGLMGHSMGGAAAVELGRERNDISAVIDLDGTMLSEYNGIENGALAIREEPYPVPVLEFNNWEMYNDLKEYLAQGGSYPNDVLIRGASAGFTTTIRDTKHMDFTDLPLLSPFLGNMLGSGDRDTAEAMAIVNSLVLEFYDCYLKGQGVFTVQDIY